VVNARRLGRLGGLAVGLGIGAALAAPSAGADTATDLDPLEDLFGNTGFNSWTPTADTDLGALAGGLDTSVEGYETGAGGFWASDPFTALADHLDPSAFYANPDGLGLLPDNGIGDLAVGLDYTVFSTGGYGSVDLLLDGLLSALGVPDLVGF
jgi:hypothetical protein